MTRRIFRFAFGWLLLMASIFKPAVAVTTSDASCAGSLKSAVWIVVLKDDLTSDQIKTCLEQISLRIKETKDVNYMNHVQMVIVNALSNEMDQIKRLECVDSVSANVRFKSPDII